MTTAHPQRATRCGLNDRTHGGHDRKRSRRCTRWSRRSASRGRATSTRRRRNDVPIDQPMASRCRCDRSRQHRGNRRDDQVQKNTGRPQSPPTRSPQSRTNVEQEVHHLIEILRPRRAAIHRDRQKLVAVHVVEHPDRTVEESPFRDLWARDREDVATSMSFRCSLSEVALLMASIAAADATA